MMGIIQMRMIKIQLPITCFLVDHITSQNTYRTMPGWKNVRGGVKASCCYIVIYFFYYA